MDRFAVDVSGFQRIVAERRKAEDELLGALTAAPTFTREMLDWAIYFAFPCCVFGAGVGYVHGFTPAGMILGALGGYLGALGLGALYAFGARLK